MPIHLHVRSVEIFQRLSKAASATSILVGSVVLITKWLNLAILTRLGPGFAAMKANAALAFLAAGLALWLLHAQSNDQRLVVLRRVCALLVALLGGLTLSEYLVGWDVGIDQLLGRDAAAVGSAAPGRLAPITALTFLLLGIAFFLIDIFRSYRAAQISILIAMMVAIFGFMNRVYGIESFSWLGAYTATSSALPAIVTFLILCLGMLCVRPDHGWMAILTSDTAGGALARRLLPAALVVPALLGWLQVRGQTAGLYDSLFGLALFASATMVVFTGLIAWSAASLYRVDSARQHAEATLHQLYADLEARVLERTAQLTSVNQELAHEIVVRTQIEADLRESQERFASLFRNSPAGITLTRLRDGQYLDVNERFLGLVGLTRDEVIGRSSVELGLLSAAAQDQLVQQIRTQDGVHERTVPIRIASGDVRMVSLAFDVVEVGNEACALTILSDITERAERQAALRASEDRFAKAFRNSPAALTITRLSDSVFIDVNASFLTLFDYERDEVIGRRSTDLAINTNPEERAGLMEHMRQDGSITNYELVLRTKSNHLRTILMSTDPLDLDGQEHVLTTMLDITPRKDMEVALREREATLRTLFEVLPVGIAMVDRERRIVETNPALERILDLTHDDLARSIYADRTYIHPDGTPLRLEEFPSLRAVREQRAILDVEMGVILESGQTRWTSVSAAPLAVADLGAVIVTTDITERRHAEAALTQERDLLQALMDNIPDSMYFKDTAARFTRINRAQAQVLGLREPAEAIGKTDADFYPPQFAAESYAGEQHVVRTGQPLIDHQEFNPEAGGQPRWFSVTKVPMYDRTGGVIGLIGIARDITGRIEAEAALQQANAQLSARVDQLALLNQLEEQLQACVSIQEVYDVTAVLASHLFRTEVGVVAVINSSRTRVEPVAAWGEPPAAAQAFGLEDCWALRRGQPHVVSDGHASIRCPHVTAFAPAFALCIPLLAQGEALGVISLRSGPTTARASFEEVQQLLRVVADGVALAVANLRLREALRQQSIRDPLTELFNRRYMEESLERELLRAARTQTSVGIIMLDVDHFKRINDRYGHDTGDAVLRQLGTFLKQRTRGDDIACRYGGEEFTLILPAATREQTRIRAEHLRQEFKHSRLIHAGTFIEAITLSFGVAAYPDHGTTRDTVVRAADTALYRAKRAGRDCVSVAE